MHTGGECTAGWSKAEWDKLSSAKHHLWGFSLLNPSPFLVLPKLLYIRADTFYCFLLALATVSKESIYLLIDWQCVDGEPILDVGERAQIKWELSLLLHSACVAQRLRSQSDWSMSLITYKLLSLNELELQGSL